jgi:hypothetical protein
VYPVYASFFESACGLMAFERLGLQAIKKFPAALQITSRQLIMWPDKIPDQIVVFNSHSSSALVLIL